MNGKPYILCADDVQMNQILITEMLEKYFDIECINHGSDCIESVAQKRPDLILLGESMPLRDDYDVCKFLREDIQYKEIPIISLSAKTSSAKNSANDKSANFGEAYGEEYDLYLSQPFDEELLISSIKRLLS